MLLFVDGVGVGLSAAAAFLVFREEDMVSLRCPPASRGQGHLAL